MRYRELSHTADLAVRVYGKDVKELFINALSGLYHVFVRIEMFDPDRERDIELTSSDKEGLLVEWLNELIFIFRTEKMIVHDLEMVMLTHERLKARCVMARQKGDNCPVKAQIKAATYHGLEIKKKKGLYYTDIIFDV